MSQIEGPLYVGLCLVSESAVLQIDNHSQDSGTQHGKTVEASCVHATSPQKCPTLCDPMDCNPPGSSVHRILQAIILEWVAMPSSSGSS